MPEFVPGLELCRLYYEEAVRPIIDRAFPSLLYAAARIGPGSEILGFDTEMSTDHDWGPRLLLFLENDSPVTESDRIDSPKLGGQGAQAIDSPKLGGRGAQSIDSLKLGGRGACLAEAIRETLSRQLPSTFRGYPTGYSPNEDGTLALDSSNTGPVRHNVETIALSAFFRAYLDFDIRQEIRPADWLTFPEQKLRTIASGAVYHDAIGLNDVRSRFAYYPRDVWLYLLAAAWNRIGQEEHLMGRAGFIGDDIGSALIGARLVRDLMRLCFLMERQYAPYPKWFGTAFHRLDCAPKLEPLFREALRSETWQEREAALVQAYDIVAAMHNALEVTDLLPTVARPFYNRPFRVIHLEADFAGALCREIHDPAVKQIADRRLVGSIDQFSDSTDILSAAEWRQTLRGLYE